MPDILRLGSRVIECTEEDRDRGSNGGRRGDVRESNGSKSGEPGNDNLGLETKPVGGARYSIMLIRFGENIIPRWPSILLYSTHDAVCVFNDEAAVKLRHKLYKNP